MKTYGIVSCNIHVNFTNYGSALQSWALCRSVEMLGYKSKLVDYCPPMMEDRDILNPMKHMWDTDEDSRRNLELTMPALRMNFHKFDTFYNCRFNKTKKSYTSRNFNDIVEDEAIVGFVCGSDTIFCIDEWNGFEDAYFADYNYEMSETYAKDLLNEFSNDTKVLRDLANYYTKTSRK